MHQQAGKTKGVTIPPAKLLNLALVTAALGLCSYTPGETSKISDGDGAFHINKARLLVLCSAKGMMSDWYCKSV